MDHSVSLVLFLATLTAAQIRIEYELEEEMEAGFVLGNLKQDSGILDQYDPDVVDRMRFGLISVEYQSLFDVDEATGVVYVEGELDRETICRQGGPETCVISVEAAVVQPLEYFTILLLDVTVNDVNDNSPRFGQSQYTVMVSENAAVKSQYMLPMATDPDSGANGIQSYRLAEPSQTFSLFEGSVPSGLSLVLEDRLDRETRDEYVMEVVAVDGGMPSRSGTLTVHVRVIDANDNSPKFDRDVYEVTIPENYELYLSIIQVSATDLDEGQNGQLLYTLSPQSLEQYGSVFAVNNKTGVLYLVSPLDYLMGSRHQLIVLAYDLGSNPLQAHTTVIVSVLDVNNHKPEVSVHPVISGQSVGVRENATPGEIVALVTVKDQDQGNNGICTCHSLDRNFSLEAMYRNGYKLTTSLTFDREADDTYRLTITCQDSGSPALSSDKQITLVIFDENDNSPIFDVMTYKVSVREDSAVGMSVIQVHASDRDQDDAARLTYSLDHEADKHLSIDPVSGIVTIRDTFDHEEAAFLEYTVLAQDNGFPVRGAQAKIQIEIIDINDEAPVFIQNKYNFGTYENQANVTDIGSVKAVDRDSDPYNVFAYSLYGPASVFKMFSIDPESGQISTRVSLDREDHDVHHLIVMATDIEPPHLSSSVGVTIYVADKNDNSPTITFPSQSNRTLYVSTYTPVDFVFSRVIATDPDLGKNAKLEYALVDDHGLFAVDPIQGYLLVRSSLHDAGETVLDLTVVVTDAGIPPLSADVTFQVKINSSLVFAEELALFGSSRDNDINPDLSEHEKILIALGAATSLIVAILIAAIVFVKRRQVTNYKKEVFNCSQRVNYTQKLASLTVGQEGTGEEDNNQPVNPACYQCGKDGVCITNKTNTSDCNQAKINQLTAGLAKTSLEPDAETASRYSAELSNTDSGHGPSEEGDTTEKTASTETQQGTETGPTTKIPHQTSNSRQLPHLRASSTPSKAYPSLASHEQGIWHEYMASGNERKSHGRLTDCSQAISRPYHITQRFHDLTCHKRDTWNVNSNHVVWSPSEASRDDSNDDDMSSASSGSFIINPLSEMKSINV